MSKVLTHLLVYLYCSVLVSTMSSQYGTPCTVLVSLIFNLNMRGQGQPKPGMDLAFSRVFFDTLCYNKRVNVMKGNISTCIMYFVKFT